MSERARIVSLAAGSNGLEASLIGVPRMPGVRRKPTPPAPIGPRVRPLPYGGQVYRAVNLSDVADAYERLASMVLARKMMSGEFIPAGEKLELLRLAQIPADFEGSELTSMVFTASADELGKGGVIGSISNAVSSAAKSVGGAVQKVADVTVKPIAQTTAQMAKIAAPITANIPVIGPGVSAALNISGSQLDVLSRSSVGSIVRNPAGTVMRVLGGAAGAGGALIGAGAQGVGQAGELVAGGAEYLAQGVQGLITGGRDILGSLSDEFVKGIEGTNPSLAGKLTGLFKQIPAQYAQFGPVFDRWSAALKDQPAGQWLGKVGGQFYTMIKDSSGNFRLKQHEMSEVPSTIGNQVAEGGLSPADSTLYAAPGQLAGAGYGPAYPVAGIPMNPAGLSLPAGPFPGASLATDNTGMHALVGAIRDAVADNARKAELEAKSPGVSPTLLVALLGVAAGGAFLISRGSQPTAMRPLRNRPRRRARRRSRR